MYIVKRSATFMRALLKSYGPSRMKQKLWDQEFSGGHWNFIDNTLGDCVYPHLARHARHGSILDLGCGPGNTATELDAAAYQTYVGVDISDVALDKARKRTAETGRAGKNDFVQSDFISYVPNERFDVILFRESMYHVPLGKVKATLDRYTPYLKDGGVFVVRMATAGSNGGKEKYRPKAMLRVIEAEFAVVENHQHNESGATVIVFKPRQTVSS